MCGNFGLLILGILEKQEKKNESYNSLEDNYIDDLDASLHQSMHLTSLNGGIKLTTSQHDGNEGLVDLLQPSVILENQTAITSIRGGQAGGYSTFEFEKFDKLKKLFYSRSPVSVRVRVVGRKRHLLSTDLANLYRSRLRNRAYRPINTVTAIGHTRFATSSVNVVPELHPHEWTPRRVAGMWRFDPVEGHMTRGHASSTMHITHNGDFDNFRMYGQLVNNAEVGIWLEKVLWKENNLKGDSPKIAGMMELLRTQGSWLLSARLAYIRVTTQTLGDVFEGASIEKIAGSQFPPAAYFARWEAALEAVWVRHINNIVRKSSRESQEPNEVLYSYTLEASAEKQLVEDAVKSLLGGEGQELRTSLGIEAWSEARLRAFIKSTVVEFLRADLYTACCEFLLRAEGSFGLQMHCECEPGVVLVASKGQPMLVALHPSRPIALFASEAEALAVPVDEAGHSMPLKVALDSRGEVLRLGEPRALFDGSYSSEAETEIDPNSTSVSAPAAEVVRSRQPMAAIPEHEEGGAYGSEALEELDSIACQSIHSRSAHGGGFGSSHGGGFGSSHGGGFGSSHGGGFGSVHGGESRPFIVFSDARTLMRNPTLPSLRTLAANRTRRIQLVGGVEIISYSLSLGCEQLGSSFLARALPIETAPAFVGQGRKSEEVDLVAEDLRVTPAILHVIEEAWANPGSVERVAGAAFAAALVEAMRARAAHSEANGGRGSDTIDLLVAGVEVSLWVAEQWAYDLRAVFPLLNVTTVSANKLLGLGSERAGKIFFPGSESVLSRRITGSTVALLVSQSGQTFPTLHATRRLCEVVGSGLWLVTGCFNSNMEVALREFYQLQGLVYGRDRVFNNYSGLRPAEPSSAATAALWHTLTQLLLEVVRASRQRFPSRMVVHAWTYVARATAIQRVYRGHAARRQHPDLLRSLALRRSNSSRLFKNGNDSLEEVKQTEAADALAEVTHAQRKIELLSRRVRFTTLLSDGCVSNIEHLLRQNVVRNISLIVGYDAQRRPLSPLGFQTTPHVELVMQGRRWAAHINEPWQMMVLAGTYIMLSAGLNLTLFGLLGDAVVAVLRAAGVNLGHGILEFGPRFPNIILGQSWGWSLAGLVLQMLDAAFFVYVAKNLTLIGRLLGGRALWARHGKRTLVIVDNPCVHQLAENFASKLFSLSYSFCSLEVHGASGLDHFVHRFTHRVQRGLLLAVGRPDGRLSCLARSEAAVLLSVKQAAFIQNPSYPGAGNGPEIVTVGHNPYRPNLGLSHCIMLTARTAEGKTVQRLPFVDEYLFRRLHMASSPFAAPLLRQLALSHARILAASPSCGKGFYDLLPEGQANNVYGMHHVDPALALQTPTQPLFLEYIMAVAGSLKQQESKLETKKAAGKNYTLLVQGHLDDKPCEEKEDELQNADNDPGLRAVFGERLDRRASRAQELQVIVQQFYESRVASLERYLAFCVMFHAMAADCRRPWLCTPWDIAKSQSNLRVATTACPIAASEPADADKALSPRMATKIKSIYRGYTTNF